MNNCRPSILVAGAGINGMLTAHALLRTGARVSLCDAGSIPESGSASHGLHRLIHPFGKGGEHAAKALKFWRQILAEIGCEGFLSTGVLTTGRTLATDMDIPCVQADRYLLGASRAAPISFAPGYGVLLAKRILNSLAAFLGRIGANLRPGCKVASLNAATGLVTFTSAAHTPEPYDHVVVATGHGTASITGVKAIIGPFRPRRAYVLYMPQDRLPRDLTPRSAWAGLSGANLWGMPPIDGLPAKFGFGGMSHSDTDQSKNDDKVRMGFADVYARLDPRYACLSDGQVASNVYAECPADSRAVTAARCTVLTSDNGMGFKFAPLAAQEAAQQVQVALSADQHWVEPCS